jgi:hypothetical protein
VKISLPVVRVAPVCDKCGLGQAGDDGSDDPKKKDRHDGRTFVELAIGEKWPCPIDDPDCPCAKEWAKRK